MATTTKNWVKWDLAAVYKDWKCCTQRTSGFFPVGSQPWTNIPPPPRPIISVCKKQGALEWDSWMCILAVLLNNCMDLGVFLILRKPHYPHLDMAVIMPTSWIPGRLKEILLVRCLAEPWHVSRTYWVGLGSGSRLRDSHGRSAVMKRGGDIFSHLHKVGQDWLALGAHGVLVCFRSITYELCCLSQVR